MASYQKEREDFVVAMDREGVPAEVTRAILRDASTIQRLAVVACNDEAADRDRVRCPADSCPCLCQDYGDFDFNTSQHGKVPRYALTDRAAQRRIVARLAPYNVSAVFDGDPRGACVKLRVPSGRTDDSGQIGICVPTRDY